MAHLVHGANRRAQEQKRQQASAQNQKALAQARAIKQSRALQSRELSERQRLQEFDEADYAEKQRIAGRLDEDQVMRSLGGP